MAATWFRSRGMYMVSQSSSVTPKSQTQLDVRCHSSDVVSLRSQVPRGLKLKRTGSAGTHRREVELEDGDKLDQFVAWVLESPKPQFCRNFVRTRRLDRNSGTRRQTKRAVLKGRESFSWRRCVSGLGRRCPRRPVTEISALPKGSYDKGAANMGTPRVSRRLDLG